MKKIIAVCFMLLMWGVVTAAPSDLKQIHITDTNNFRIGQLAGIDAPRLKSDFALKKYVFERIQFEQYQEPQLFFEVLDWVASQWQHDGMNAAPKSMSSLEILEQVHQHGQRYRCVEYGKVMADILASMGHYSRTIGLQSVDVAYGGWGKGHVATEVWSNHLNKWLFFDPQFSIYARYEGELLNIYDIFQLKKAGSFNNIEFITTPKYAKSNNIDTKEHTKKYRKFLTQYLGYHVVSFEIDKQPQRQFFLMEANQPTLLFQGTANSNTVIFTRDVNLAYPQLNRTYIQIHAEPNSQQSNHKQILKQLNVKTNEQYIDEMWRWAPEGKLHLAFTSDMPDVQHYQIRLDNGSWKTLSLDTYQWNLKEGINRIEVRSQSKQGLHGPVTYINVSYSHKAPTKAFKRNKVSP